ncbi:MAG: hypothetical protein GON13_00085, partial [Nanoarchaeota archaeon]|nr:hypothetical protein [Nanoarchaeota archaeon]
PHNNFCLISNSYDVTPEKEKDCVMMGSLVASAKASLGVIKSKRDLLKVKASVSRKGLEYLRAIENESGIIRMNNFSIIITPNIMAKKVKSTVGLGDCISSIAFVSETI